MSFGSTNVKLLLTTILLISTLTTAQANLGTFKGERLINPDTNQPYTGNLEVLNKDWGNDVVEFSKDYVDGLLHGTEKSYYKSGRLKSIGKFNQGKVNGVVTSYYENGVVQIKANFNNGIKEGRVTYYYSNGNPMESTPYSKGVVHGIAKTYWEEGGVFEEVKFEQGQPKYMMIYREDGTLADKKGFLDRKVIDRIVG